MATLYDPCEPFRAYNRLEGRPREEELDDALAAKVHDPLWMLARQYQFGELKGEDAGSAVFAKVAINTVRMTSFIGANGNEVPYSEDIPLETRVERLIPVIDNRLAARLGKKFLQLLDQEGANANPALNYSAGMYTDRLKVRFAFEVQEIQPTDSAPVATAKAREKSLQQAAAFTRALAGRAVNGRKLWEHLNGNSNAIKSLLIVGNNAPTKNKFVLAAHEPILIAATQKWLQHVKESLQLPDSDTDDCWYPERMEYGFETRVKEGNNGKTTLQASEYFHGHLDWYSFDVSQPNPSRQRAFNANVRKREVLTVIPTEASFAGMPNSRWWEMEDGTIDLGNLKASDTDITKILVTQFALQYSNDWLSIPYDLTTGSLAQVEGIVVRDTFGQYVLVEAAHKSGEDWNSWNMYALTVAKGEFEDPEFDKRVLLPPAAAKTIESEPLEEVKFIRDEMANMVWGIESRIPDGLGGGIDGYEAAKNLKDVFESLMAEENPDVEITLPEIDLNANELKANTYKPQLKYMLGNTVSENWIPFIAVHKPQSYREIHFQRASMPRIIDLFAPHAIRPRTQLLRLGVNDSDNQITPYYINEEEIPRAGVRVTGTYQRTRWYNGKIVSWYGRRKRTGRGEGSSGLRFDMVLDNT